MAQSDELTAFYQSYLEWVTAGAPEDSKYGFSRGVGLCASLRYFCWKHGCRFTYPFEDEMTEQFIAAGLHPRTPFNACINSYRNESTHDETYLNLKRIQWVKDHC